MALLGRRDGTAFGPPAVVAAFDATAAVQAVAVLVAVPLAARPARSVPLRRLAGGLAVVGSLAVTVQSSPDAGRWAAWGATGLGCLGVWVEVLLGARADRRDARRRTAWLVVMLAGTAVVAAAAALGLAPGASRSVVAGLLVVQAASASWLALRDRFRPLDEHLLDVGLVVAALTVTVLVGGLLRLGAALTGMPSPGAPATVGAVLTAAAAAPAALWVRRSVLARRYGPGVIAPSDVAVITEDLHARTDPRDLLDKAARMVAAASGCRGARLVLGPEPPEVPPEWVVHPLDVAGERVGSLAVEAAGPEGLEPRQASDVARLVPTVALVARAVTLAVEAELARRDAARERDLERRRILADLHDGLGPALAGMSMRVRAALRAGPGDGTGTERQLLGDLADGLATSRADLRRLVSGITPSALDHGDLADALEDLVVSFRGQGGPTVALSVALDDGPGRDTGVTVYRCVAEGITNALRHARPTAITVSVSSCPDGLSVTVADDGAGGPVVPGVGLSSLRARAEALGGTLTVGAGSGTGTVLRLLLPAGTRMPG